MQDMTTVSGDFMKQSRVGVFRLQVVRHRHGQTARSPEDKIHARSCVVIVTVVSAAVIRRSVVWQTDANNQYNRIGLSDFGETESIRIANRNALLCR